MIYLSRLTLNPRSRRVQAEVARPYEMHHSLMKAFPDGLAPDQERVLWRLEADDRGGALTLLVQSWEVPDWAWAAEAPGYLLAIGESNPAVKPVDLRPRLSTGQVLAFRLLANPTKKMQYEKNAAERTAKGDKYNGTRVGITGDEDRNKWLQRKGEQGGFTVVSVHATHPDRLVARGGGPRDGDRVEFLAVRFDGLLSITDPDALYEAVRHGIGSGKGFGFGLLSLAPAPAREP